MPDTLAPDGVTNAFNFPNLPDDIKSFGNHKVTMTVNTYDPVAKKISTHDSTTAYFQTFFPADANNHPNPDNSSAVAQQPNWYYYYNKLFPVNGPTPLGNNYNIAYKAGQGHSVAHADGTDATNPQNDNVVITDDANTQSGLSVFDVDPDTHFLRYAGDIVDLRGIFSFIAVVAHEQGHVNSYIAQYTIGSSMHSPYIGSKDPSDPSIYRDPSDPNVYSSDKDNIWDAWENSHLLNGSLPDTTGAYGPVGPDGIIISAGYDIPDNEVLADVTALGKLLNHYSDWQMDWADNGINVSQKGLNTEPPYFITERPTALGYNKAPDTPTFYFRFRPTGNAALYLINQHKMPTLSGGAYPIRSLDDLKALLPNVRASFSDLEAPIK